MRDRWRRRVLAAQAAYYLVTGFWPLLHMRSFEAVTGPKTDDWLVHMVGWLVVVIGATLSVAVARARERSLEIVVLAGGSALAFILIDVWYVAVGRISPIYLADVVPELGVIAGLVLTRRAN